MNSVKKPPTTTYQPTFGPNVNSLTVPSILDPNTGSYPDLYQGPQRKPFRPALQRQVSVDLSSTILEEMSSSDSEKSSGKSFMTVRRSSRRIRRTRSDSSAIDTKTDLDSTTDDQKEPNSPKTIIGRSLRITCL